MAMTFLEEKLESSHEACELSWVLTSWSTWIRSQRKWLNSLDPGRNLKDLWSKGQKYDPVEIAHTLGYEGLDPSLLVREIERRFC